MTIVYSQNFSTTTVGTLPSGWTDIVGTWAITATAPITGGTNALASATTDGNTIVCTDGGPLADMEVRYDVNYQDYFVGVYLRADSELQNGYVIIPAGTNLSSFNVYKRVSGTYTQIGTIGSGISYLGTLGVGYMLSVRARIQGSTIYFRIWEFGTTEPGTWTGTLSDTLITAAGYFGFYNNSNGSTPATVNNVTLNNLVASSLSVSPTSVTANTIGSSLTLTGIGTSWTSGTPGSPTFAVSGGMITAQTVTSATSATLTYTAPSSAGSVTITDPSTSNTTTLTINAAAASDFSLTPGTLNATVGNPSGNYAVLPNGAPSSSLSIVLSDGEAGGTFTPSSLTFTTSAAQTFTYTPASAGTKTLTATPYGAGLATPHTAQCVASTGPLTIGVTNAALFWSPGNWDHLTIGTFGVSADTMQATAPGAYLKFQVTGTANLAIDIDNSTNGGFPAGDMPIIRYSINAAPFSDVQLSPSQTNLSLSSSLTTGDVYSVEIYFKASSNTNGYADVWGSSGVSPTNVLRINGVTIDGPGSALAATLRPRRMLIFGDSITAGEHANSDGSDDSTASFACSVALALDAELGQIGYGGQGWTATGGSNAAPFATAWDLYSTGRSREFSGLDYIAVVHGGNDLRGSVAGSTIQSDCQSWLASVRAAAGSATFIFVIVECMGAYEGSLSAAVTAYKASSGDTKVYLIDATSLLPAGVFTINFGALGQWTYDQVHPLAYGHSRISAAYSELIGKALNLTTSTLTGYSRGRVANA